MATVLEFGEPHMELDLDATTLSTDAYDDYVPQMDSDDPMTPVSDGEGSHELSIDAGNATTALDIEYMAKMQDFAAQRGHGGELAKQAEAYIKQLNDMIQEFTAEGSEFIEYVQRYVDSCVQSLDGEYLDTDRIIAEIDALTTLKDDIKSEMHREMDKVNAYESVSEWSDWLLESEAMVAIIENKIDALRSLSQQEEEIQSAPRQLVLLPSAQEQPLNPVSSDLPQAA